MNDYVFLFRLDKNLVAMATYRNGKKWKLTVSAVSLEIFEIVFHRYAY